MPQATCYIARSSKAFAVKLTYRYRYQQYSQVPTVAIDTQWVVPHQPRDGRNYPGISALYKRNSASTWAQDGNLFWSGTHVACRRRPPLYA